MTAEIIQADYERLEQIATQFGQRAELTALLYQQVRESMAQLSDGGWVGHAAAAFLGEMENEICPAIERLTHALEQAQTITLEIKQSLESAEEEAARPFANGHGDQRTPNGEHNDANHITSPSDSSQERSPATPTTVPPAHTQRVFNERYMEDFIGTRLRGEDSPQLNQLLESLLRTTQSGETDRAKINPLLDQIADLRGVDRSTIRNQYDTYMQLHENATSKGDIDLSRHGDFMGSTASLRYGKVVGDVYGIDPVFGALLNPTGGLVGPGDDSYEPGDNDAIGYHGIFHDAAGYLYNHQGQIGPGYDYMDREPFPTTNPLTGQVGGISWWASHPQLDVDILPRVMPDIPYVPAFVEQALANTIEDAPVTVIRQGIYVIEGSSDVVEGVSDIFKGDIAEGADDIWSGAKTIATGTVRTVSDIFSSIL